HDLAGNRFPRLLSPGGASSWTLNELSHAANVAPARHANKALDCAVHAGHHRREPGPRHGPRMDLRELRLPQKDPALRRVAHTPARTAAVARHAPRRRWCPSLRCHAVEAEPRPYLAAPGSRHLGTRLLRDHQ